MISYITTPTIVIAAILTAMFKLPVSSVAPFCLTIGVVCFFIGVMEIKSWQRVKEEILVMDGILQLFTGMAGLLTGSILYFLG